MAVQLLDFLCFLQLLIAFKKNSPFAFLMYFMLSSTTIILSKSMEINLPASQSNLPVCPNLNLFFFFVGVAELVVSTFTDQGLNPYPWQ